jgi:hypothetical protein
MTVTNMDLRELLEKTADTDFLRGMIGFTERRRGRGVRHFYNGQQFATQPTAVWIAPFRFGSPTSTELVDAAQPTGHCYGQCSA